MTLLLPTYGNSDKNQWLNFSNNLFDPNVSKMQRKSYKYALFTLAAEQA